MTKPKPRIKIPDDYDQVPELTREDMRQFRPAEEVLPPEVLAHLPKGRPGQRGPGKTPAKVPVSFRFEPDLAKAVKAAGRGRVASILSRALGVKLKDSRTAAKNDKRQAR